MGKRIREALTVICFLLALLVSFSGNDSPEEEGDWTRIVMTYQYMNYSDMQHMEEIVDAVNAISRETIGVEVELLPVHAMDSFTDYPLWLSKGERIDLMLINYQNIMNYVDREMLLPLNGLLAQYGTGIEEISSTKRNLYRAATAGDAVYGCDIFNYNFASGGGLWISEELLDEIGFPFEGEHIYSMEELDILFARLKARYPARYPLGQITAGNAFSTFNFYNGISIAPGGDYVSGVADKDCRLFDLFESEEYLDFLSWMREWYLKGYIYPEAAYTDLLNLELLKSGITMSHPLSSQPGIVANQDVAHAVCLKTSTVTYSPGGRTGTFWTIPETSVQPEAAMKFLNLMYTDARIVNLFQYGIEGTDYVFVDEENGIIAEPDTDAGKRYKCELGVYGNMTLMYVREGEGEALKQEQEAYAKAAVPSGMEYEGFFFDAGAVEPEMARVQEVLSDYLPVLESGSIPLTVNYDRFVGALKEAGIDEIIEEKQRQLDAWLEESS